jgi:hypothetical protein
MLLVAAAPVAAVVIRASRSLGRVTGLDAGSGLGGSKPAGSGQGESQVARATAADAVWINSSPHAD